jgi:hypothetical protein
MSEKKKIEWWPIGIGIAMATFIGGILFAVSIMVRNDVPLTSDDYYAKEIAYQDEIDKSARAMSPASQPVVKTLPASEAVEVKFPSHKQGNAFQGTATFFRPSDPQKDFTVDLQPDSTGQQWLSLRGRDAGLWVMQLSWSEGEVPYYYEQQILR